MPTSKANIPTCSKTKPFHHHLPNPVNLFQPVPTCSNNLFLPVPTCSNMPQPAPTCSSPNNDQEKIGTRYPPCDCKAHIGQLSYIWNRNVEVRYGSCARTCVFCNTSYSKVTKLRHHAPKCRASSNIQVHPEENGVPNRQGHTWSPLPEREEIFASQLGGQFHRPVSFHILIGFFYPI